MIAITLRNRPCYYDDYTDSDNRHYAVSYINDSDNQIQKRYPSQHVSS